MKKIRKIIDSNFKIKKNVIIFSSIGASLIIISTFIIGYIIPEINDKVSELDLNYNDAKDTFNQFEVVETTGYIPYNTFKLLNSLNKEIICLDSLIYFYNETNRIKLSSINLLSWPKGLSNKDWNDLKKLNFNQLEKIKADKGKSFIEKVKDIALKRDNYNKKKQTLLLFSTICQVIGLFLTQIAVLITFIKLKN